MQERFRQILLQICHDHPQLKFDFKYRYWETDFLRFYQSQVNYNITKSSCSLYSTIYKGKRSYSFKLYDPDEKVLMQTIMESIPLLDHLPEDPDFVDLEDNLETYPETDKVNNIVHFSLEKKLDILNRISSAVESFGFKIYGTFICNFETEYVVNSNGVNKRSQSSPVMLELKAVSDKNQVTVLETYGSENPDSFDVDTFIRNLTLKLTNAGKNIIDVEPGHYDVILSPRCIGEYIGYLQGAMSAESLDQKMSYFEDKLDTQVFPKSITLADDPHYPDMINFDYNGDGHIYRKLTLIENGIFRNFFVSNYYAHKTGMKKNGNVGACMVLSTGDKSLEQMIGGIKKGLYISSLHYMNFINYKETSVTGLTRDGTFLIENGKLTNVVNNLRFTERLARIIENIVEIENKSYTIPISDNYDEFSIMTTRMPHVKVTGYQISSSTKTI
jgi:PmbA protein